MSLNSSWEVYARWHNNTGVPVTRFETTWTVPPAPVSSLGVDKSAILVYLFNSLSTEKLNEKREIVSDRVIQPVLKYGLNGDTAAGRGGNFWSIASWWAGGPKDPFVKRPSNVALRVEPGQVLKGILTQTAASGGGGFTLTSEFEGFPDTKLAISVATEAKFLDLVMETTNPLLEIGESFPVPQKYPPIFSTSMRNINIQPLALCTKINFTVPWVIQGALEECGEHAIIRDGQTTGGIVDLCYGIVAPASISGISTVDGSYDLFVVRQDGHLLHKSNRDAQWDDLGPSWLSALSVVSRGPRSYDVFGVGSKGEAQWGHFDGGAWHAPPHPSLRDRIKGSLAATVSDAGKLDLFGIGWGEPGKDDHDGRLQHIVFEKGKWASTWEQGSGDDKTFMSSPVTCISTPGDVEIFAIMESTVKDLDGGQLCHRIYRAGGVTEWKFLGHVLTVPAVVVLDNGGLCIFAILAERNGRHIQYSIRPGRNQQWDDWISLGSWDSNNKIPWASAPVAVARPGGLIDVFALGKDNQIHHKACKAGTWQSNWDTVSHLGDITSVPSVTLRKGTNIVEIAALDLQNQVVQKTLTGDQFSHVWNIWGKT